MARRVITREEMVETFAPARGVIERAVAHARQATTLERYAALHPEIEREAGLQRLAGQGRWLMLAEGLVATIETVQGFSVRSTEGQHNRGQYLFKFPGGLLTVKQEPHDLSNPDDGRYIQEQWVEMLAEAELAPGLDADAPIIVYLAVTAVSAVLKICHETLAETMKIPISDLVAAPMPASARPERRRARARSTLTPARHGQRPAADTPPATL